MTGNSEYRDNKTTQSFAGVPGIPGGDATPNYMQEYPTESNYESTTYNDKNAIWDSGTSIIGYKNASFANSATGLQFRADTKGSSGPIGAPGNPDSTNVYLRVKRSARPYDPWYEIYHTGNLDLSKFASKNIADKKADLTYVNSKTANKVERAYFETNINTINQNIAPKIDKTSVDESLSSYVTTTWANDRIKEKMDFDVFVNKYAAADQKLKDFEKKVNDLDARITSKLQNKKNNI